MGEIIIVGVEKVGVAALLSVLTCCCVCWVEVWEIVEDNDTGAVVCSIAVGCRGRGRGTY